MSNQFFKFKQFTIFHDRCGMKVGTDGVLLGAWARVDGARRLLDVGAGSGLIAIQMAQRNPVAEVEAVEIDAQAAAQAEENAARSPWAGRIRVACADFRTFEAGAPFDAIVSNPPYFVDALRSPDARRRLARHAEGLGYDLLFRRSRRLLAPGGHVSLIVPAEVEKLAADAAWEHGFRLWRRTDVYTKPGKPLRRILLEWGTDFLPCRADSLCIERAEGGYSEAYRALTRDFYLNF